MQNSPHAIIPVPREFRPGAGAFCLGEQLPFSFDPLHESTIPFLKEALAPARCTQAPAGGRLTLKTDPSLPREGYRLRVTPDAIKIEAPDAAGGFYAVQTLRQLRAGGEIPCCELEDAPRFAWRSVMLDEARHFFGMDTVKMLLDQMARYKLNRFHWHLSDDQGFRVEIDAYPLLTEKGSIRAGSQITQGGKIERREYGRGCFYRKDQIREIVAYAKERYIEIVPEIDMPGHLSAAIACYPWLSCEERPIPVEEKWGIFDTIGCCGKEETYAFAKTLIDELCGLFPFPYFHIGGDEAPKTKWKACPRCQAKMRALSLTDENELQGYFCNVLSDYLRQKGRAAIGWNEILEAPALSTDTVIQWWTDSGSPRAKAWVADGHPVVLSPTDTFYFDMPFCTTPLRKTYAFEPALLGISPREEPAVLGLEGTLWAEYISDRTKLEAQAFPRLLAFSEVCWAQKERRDYDDFLRRLCPHELWLREEGLRPAPRALYNREGTLPPYGRMGNWIE